MSKTLISRVAFVPLVAALAACGGAPETTRATNFQQFQEVQLSELARRFRAETPYVVLFDFDASSLDATARARLDRQAEWIIANPKVKFRIAGHTDKVGNVAYNEALGLRRATEVLGYFVSKGIDPDRLVAMASFGEEAPVIDTEAPERANRRVTTDVLGFVEEIQEEADTTLAALTPVNGIVEAEVVDDTPAPATDDDADVTAEAGETGTSDTGSTGSDTGSTGSTGSDTGSTGSDTGSTGSDTGSSSGGNKGNGKGGGSNANSGRGNGDDGGDPGNSEGHNNGGDEMG